MSLRWIKLLPVREGIVVFSMADDSVTSANVIHSGSHGCSYALMRKSTQARTTWVIVPAIVLRD